MSAVAVNNTQVQKYGNAQRWAQRWASLKGQLSRVAEEGREIATKTVQASSGVATFGGLYYWRQRRVLAGKQVTFDKAGKIDAFFWPGLVVSVLGITPLLGDAGKFVVPIGTAAMCVGAVGMIDKLAADHHAKK